MARDAKLGLVVGVGVVLAIAVTFFRKDQATATTTAASTALRPARPAPSLPPDGGETPTPAPEVPPNQ